MINKLSLAIFVAVALLLYLLFSNIGRLDLVATKSDAVVKMHKFDIQAMQNIDSVKIEAFHLIDDYRDDFKERSKTASIHIYIILGLIAIQLLLLRMTNNRKKKVSN